MVTQRFGAVGHVVHAAVDFIQAIRDCPGGVRGVVSRFVNDAAERANLFTNLIQGAALQVDMDIGLRHARNAANLPSSVDAAVVDAGGEISAAASHDAADVIADVLIAYGAMIDAAQQRAIGITRHAAAVRSDIEGIGTDEAQQASRHVYFQPIRRNGRIQSIGIDIGPVGAVAERTPVLARDAAGHGFAKDASVHLTAAQHTLCGVEAHNAANALRAVDCSGKGAVAHRTVILSRDAADTLCAALRIDGSLHGKLTHHARWGHDAKQARRGNAGRHAQVGNCMAVALKGTAKAGDRGKLHTAEGNVPLQNHGLSLRPDIIGALLGKRAQLLRAADINRVLTIGCPDGSSELRHQGEQQEKGIDTAQILISHGCPPPLPHCRRAAPASPFLPPYRAKHRLRCRGSRRAPCR